MATLPYYTYFGVIDDLGEYIKKNIPIGYHNIVLFSRKVTIKSDICIGSDYYNPPVDIVLVCETLEIPANVCINLSGKNAPDLLSFHDEANNNAWQGKAGCEGGSISIHAKVQVGKGAIHIDVHGGDGGKGQDGYVGQPGDPGENISVWVGLSPIATAIASATTDSTGKDGENGGNGGKGGKGGDAGEIELVFTLHEATFTCFSSGGGGGQGGRGGKGGKGGAGGTTGPFGMIPGRSGRDGSDGRNGSVGEKGKTSKMVLQFVDEKVFYESLPITASHLQRALNSEVVSLARAKLNKNTAKLLEVKANITWIKGIAHHNGYDILEKSCSSEIGMCGHDSEPCKSTVKVKTNKLKKHFKDLMLVANRSVNIDPTDLHSNIQNDQKMAQHAHHAKLFNHLASQFSENKTHFANLSDLALDLSSPPAFASNVKAELSTPFSTYVKDSLKNAIGDNFTKDALGGRMSVSTQAPSEASAEESTEATFEGDPLEFLGEESSAESLAGTPSEFSIDTSKLLADEGMVSNEGITQGLGEIIGEGVPEELGEVSGEGIAEGVLGEVATAEISEVAVGEMLVAETIVAPEFVLVGVVALVAVKALNVLMKAHAVELAKYEAEVHARAKLEIRNRLKLKVDTKQRDPPEPRRRKKRRKDRKSESGKYIGVLDKCEPVNSQVVATFDCIPLEFTTKERNKKVDLNALDRTQQMELTEQLQMQRSPFNMLPAFIITTTTSEGLMNEESIGKWFEFDAEFVGSGRSEAVEVTPTSSFSMGKLLKGVSAVAYNGVPVTIQSLRPLNPQLQEEITMGLGLSQSLMPPYKELGIMSLAGRGGTGSSVGRRTVKLPTGSSSRQVKKTTIKEKGGEGEKKITERGPDTKRALLKQVQKRTQLVKVANVGQGSCNILYDYANSVKLVFDAGYGKNHHPDTVLQIGFSPTIVISHWDLDHYRYLLSYPHLISGKTFIVPSFGSQRGVCVRRVSTSVRENSRASGGAYYSYGRNNTVSHQQIPFPGEIPNLELRMTEVRAGGLSKNNLNAITACIKEDSRAVLLMPGDASYSYIAREHKVGLQYLIATHHGSTRSIISDRGGVSSIPLFEGPEDKPGEVIFSYGENNAYRHNAATAMPYYQQRGWNTYRTTVNSGPGIVITV